MNSPGSGAEEIHFFVTFTWDFPETSGGEDVPAKERGKDKFSGLCLKSGYIVASSLSRGGAPVMVGFAKSRNVKKAMSESFRPVMLECYRNQKKTPPQFTNGTGTADLKPRHAELLKKLHPRQIFFAFNAAADISVIKEIMRLLEAAEYGERKSLCCHVLVASPGDTFEDAERRLRAVANMGFFPTPVMYRNETGKSVKGWGAFWRQWRQSAFCAGTFRGGRFSE